MAGHRLDPLLRPHSIAVVGASARPGAPGNEVLVNLAKGGFPGPVYAVNPARDAVGDIRCFGSLAALPEVPALVVFAVNDSRLEACFEEAASLGVRAAAIFSSMASTGALPPAAADPAEPGLAEPGPAEPGLAEPGLAEPGLAARIRDRAAAAGMLLHGGNSMGFYNFRDGVWVSGFDTRNHGRAGSVVLLSQSGAGMSGILDCEERLDFLFAASTGQELCLSVEDYLDYVLDLEETAVVGLFLETSRHPGRLVRALDKACARRIPVVALKVGRTELAARLVVSHSGALAGSDAVFDAVFRRYGVLRVDDMAELAAALILFSRRPSLPAGGLATLHDSGGERQLALDLAARIGVDYPTLAPATTAALEDLLDPGLPAVNPLDAWGSGGTGAPEYMARCFATLMADPGVALGGVVHDRAPGGGIYPGYLEYLQYAHRVTGKLVCLVANCAGSGGDPLAVEATREGFPVLDGLREFQVAARCLLAHRDYLQQSPGGAPPTLPDTAVARWRARLGAGEILDEAAAGAFLRDMGISMAAATVFDWPALPAAAGPESLEFPLVLKTAQPGIAHKSDVGGVVLGIADAQRLADAAADLAGRLGPRLLIAPMVQGDGVEMILGIARDSQFGPTVVLGIGGVYAELLGDSVVLLPPFTADEARRALDGLKIRGVLDAVRGRGPLAIDRFCDMAARLSVIAVEFADLIDELDINPVRLMVDDCIGLDALVTPSPAAMSVRSAGS